jgi:hypothetical protein
MAKQYLPEEALLQEIPNDPTAVALSTVVRNQNRHRYVFYVPDIRDARDAKYHSQGSTFRVGGRSFGSVATGPQLQDPARINVLAHENGHLLSLEHLNDKDNLMYVEFALLPDDAACKLTEPQCLIARLSLSTGVQIPTVPFIV